MVKDTLASRGSPSSVTAVKADLVWPTLTDDRSDTRDVSQFYEEFEDVCALANNCKGMSFREQLLAFRRRYRGSRLKTYTNVYRAAWKSGEVLSNPKAVYDRIKFVTCSMANSFAAFSIQVGSAGIALAADNHEEGAPLVNSLSRASQGHAVHALPLQKASPNSGKLMSLDELQQDCWHIAENEAGGYQYRTVVKVLGKNVLKSVY